MNAAKRLFHFLAVLSLCMHVMAQLAPLWATESGAFQIQICSGNTYKTISIDENGNEVPEKPTLRTQRCAFCATSTFTATPAVYADIFTPSRERIKTRNDHQHETAFISEHGRAHATRAPPAFS